MRLAEFAVSSEVFSVEVASQKSLGFAGFVWRLEILLQRVP